MGDQIEHYRDDRGIIPLYVGIFLLIGFLLIIHFFLIPPASAATWGDSWTVDSSSNYNVSIPWVWNSSAGTLNVKYYGIDASFNATYPLKNRKFGSGKYIVNITRLSGTGTTTYNGFIFNSETDQVLAYPAGNYYLLRMRNSPSTIYVQKSVAGAVTNLGSVTYFSEVGTKVSMSVIFNNQSNPRIIATFDNGINASYTFLSNDTTFQNGYSGMWRYGGSTGSLIRYDDFFINETPISTNFTCTGTNIATCTATCQNCNDPGINTRWLLSDGTQSSNQILIHTFAGAGPYSVAVDHINVAGSSGGAMRTDYIQPSVSAAPVVQALVINPSVEKRCPWWHFGFWC